MEDFVVNQTTWSNKYAIKINDKEWMPEFRHGENTHNLMLTVTTEKKAQKEIDFIKKFHPHLDLMAVEVEEEIHIDSKNNIVKQTIHEL